MTAHPVAHEPSLQQLLRLLWGHLSRRRRAQLSGLLLVMLASSAAEVVSLAAVLPFLTVLANPEGLWNQQLVRKWATFFGIDRAADLLLPITIAFALAAVTSGSIRLINLWLNGRLAAAIGSDLSCEVYRRTLYQPYGVHLSRNSSSLIASISGDVSRIITQVLLPLLLLASSGLIAIGLVVTLAVINWSIAFGLGLALVLVYLFAILSSKQPLKRLGHRQVVLTQRLIQSLQEGLGAIRDVLLEGTQEFYVKNYSKADRSLRRVATDSSFLSSYPRLVLEPIGMALIAITAYLLIRYQGIGGTLPLLGALALGAQRLLPMSQKVYEGWAQSQGAKSSLANVLDLLNQPISVAEQRPRPAPLELKDKLCFEGVRFRYRPGLAEVLRGLDIEIRSGERIGLIGSTGSGKSTTLDLLMGLLEPTSGRILVDGEDLHDSRFPERLLAWRATIAHVPQSIYLSDSSIAENIAFGLSKDQINLALVREAAKQAHIADFIESSPDGYNTFVGERGVRLSGGQRQRIGIARALYKNAQWLIFDEATSALDNETEAAVMDSIEGLSRSLTVILIAHRLSTVERCDRVIKLDQGCVLSEGTPRVVLSSINEPM